jgi:FkbH-like protein
MQPLQYPYDTQLLLRKKKSLRKQLLQRERALLPLKIAILGGSTTFDLRDLLDLFLLDAGIEGQFYLSDYNRYYEEVLFGEGLRAFQPDVIYIFTTSRNLLHPPETADSTETVEQKINREEARFLEMWETALRDFPCAVIQTNFDLPLHRSLGNLDGSVTQGMSLYIQRLNLSWARFAQQNQRFFIHDLHHLSSWVGLQHWHDLALWFQFKYAVSLRAMPHIAASLAHLIVSMYKGAKKVLALDLDHTLWGGVIGDDGADGLQLGPETATGEAYLYFQHYVRQLRQRGILLAVASKNDEQIAREGLRHPDIVLNENAFAAIRANWHEKSDNLADIAGELNVGLDSFVFFDDNPVERDLVRTRLPEVAVPEVPDDVTQFVEILDRGGYFEVSVLSTEDAERADYYLQNRQRMATLHNQTHLDYDQFLRSLDMRAVIEPFRNKDMERIAQLTNKTNQFNVTTKRYSLADLMRMKSMPVWICLSARLQDKFGDNGLVSVLVALQTGNTCEIDLWLMSCRVFKRNLEYAVFAAFLRLCEQRGVTDVYGEYRRTEKNHVVSELFGELGFSLLEQNESGSRWHLSVAKENVAIFKKSDVLEWRLEIDVD